MRSGLPVVRGGARARGPVAMPTAIDLTNFQLRELRLSERAALLDLAASNVAAYRAINNIVAMVTVEEDHDDELVITEHPVEYGAAITDHSYKRPSEVRIRVGWSQSAGVSRIGDYQVSDVKATYEELLALQQSRNPFDLYTGKKYYNNMLVAGIRVHTDARFEYSFIADITLKQILLVSTQTLSGAQNVKNPENDAQNGYTAEVGGKKVITSTMTGEQIERYGGSVGAK
jgi:hypothetical protein